MPKLTKRTVDQAVPVAKDYFIWDKELPGFGLRVFASGRKSYLVQYRAEGRTRRFTIGLHGIWTPEGARREARALLGHIARGGNPAEQKRLDTEAITIKEFCDRYIADCEAGLVLGKGRRPKKQSTVEIDRGRIKRHIVPLLGRRKVKDLTSADINRFLRDVVAGKTAADVKTRKHGRAIVRGGVGTATRTVGLLGGILTHAVQQGIIERNPAQGIRRAADQVRTRRLSEDEYRQLGAILRRKEDDDQFTQTVRIARALTLTGCRRGEMMYLKAAEVDIDRSCLRLQDSKEGASVRPIGLPAIDLLEPLLADDPDTFVFPGYEDGKALIGFPKLWGKLFKDTSLAGLTPHVLRHSFASLANDLGFTESTVAALMGHSRGTMTSRYIHAVDSALIMAADTLAGYIEGLLAGRKFTRSIYSLDRKARRETLERTIAAACSPMDRAA